MNSNDTPVVRFSVETHAVEFVKFYVTFMKFIHSNKKIIQYISSRKWKIKTSNSTRSNDRVIYVKFVAPRQKFSYLSVIKVENKEVEDIGASWYCIRDRFAWITRPCIQWGVYKIRSKVMTSMVEKSLRHGFELKPGFLSMAHRATHRRRNALALNAISPFTPHLT